MYKLPLVSIIIPTYKSSTTLKSAIDSVLNQTYADVEIIVVDDNNPNNQYREITESIMKEYYFNKKVIYVQHERNKNGAAARNTGFAKSKGDYICFLDDDDIFMKTKVEKQLEYLIMNTEFDAVYCWRYQNEKVIEYNKTGNLSEELLSLTFTPFTSSIMLKRECYKQINGFDESYRRHQDYEFMLRFFETYSIGVIREPLIEIRGNQINNALYGYDLEELKTMFLSQFSQHIERINEKQKGFKKLVLARHYSTVFWSYCRLYKIGSASRIFFKYSITCGFIFWKCVLKYLLKYFKVKRG